MPPPPGYLSFAGLCAFVVASENTVRSVVKRLRIKPSRPGGNVSLYTHAQAIEVRNHYYMHGGYYRTKSKVRKRASKSHSIVVTKD